MASYLLNHRHAEYLVDAQSSLEDLNVELRNEVRGWIEQRIETGELPAMQLEMYWAVVLGPSELLCRQTLREARAEQIQASARLLEDATWGAIRSML